MRFLRDLWYVAAWADEMVAGAPLARTLLDCPILLWRGEDGAVSALADACPHRYAPLSLGVVDADGVRCGYHGLKFDRAGRCIDNPHGGIVSARAVRASPVVLRHQPVWIWMGDAADADPSAIPDLGFTETAPANAFSKGYMYTRAGHKLLEDNILDLSHADYMHPHTLGGGSITRSTARVEERDGGNLFIEWLARNERALPIFQPEMPDPEMLTDMWTSVLWHPSGVMVLRAGATPAGQAPEEGIDTWNAHIMTPESATTTHYFYCNSRNYKMDDAGYNAAMAAGLRHAFEHEDKPMIEGQQRRLGAAELFDLKPALLATDGGSTRARRIYDRLLAAEAAAS